MFGQISKWVLVATFLFAWAGAAGAQEIRYHYVRANGSSMLAYSPRQSFGFIGRRAYYFPPVSQTEPPPPNTWLEFRHPHTHAYLTVPVNLPNGAIPQIDYRGDRVIYNYGSSSVVIHFVRDGSVDVTYQRPY